MTMWTKIKMIAASLTSGVWEFVKPLLKVYLSQAGKVLAGAAIEAVQLVASTYGEADGDVKRKAAFDIIESRLKSQGLEIGTAFINAAIETAVVKITEESK